MNSISISKELFGEVPELQLSCIECDVEILPGSIELWNEIHFKIKELSERLTVEDISRIPTIQSSRMAYKACGKDPARYRLSAEALLRRVVKGVDLYKINNVVDLLNLVSISTGFSIGGYDSNKIQGDIEFGIGRKDEPYAGVGKGKLNIEFLPVLRDAVGAFGSPTSDSERTRVTNATTRFLMVIIGYGNNELLDDATTLAIRLLKTYASATNIETQTIKV